MEKFNGDIFVFMNKRYGKKIEEVLFFGEYLELVKRDYFFFLFIC